jgi:hypothetical protein
VPLDARYRDQLVRQDAPKGSVREKHPACTCSGGVWVR